MCRYLWELAQQVEPVVNPVCVFRPGDSTRQIRPQKISKSPSNFMARCERETRIRARYNTFFFFFAHFYFPASGQTVVTGVVPSPPPFLPSVFIAHTVQQSHCSSIFPRVLLTHALALSASQFVRKESPHEFIRVLVCMRSGGFDLTKPTYTRLEDNLIRHRGDRRLTYRYLVYGSTWAGSWTKPAISTQDFCKHLSLVVSTVH